LLIAYSAQCPCSRLLQALTAGTFYSECLHRGGSSHEGGAEGVAHVVFFFTDWSTR